MLPVVQRSEGAPSEFSFKNAGQRKVVYDIQMLAYCDITISGFTSRLYNAAAAFTFTDGGASGPVTAAKYYQAGARIQLTCHRHSQFGRQC